MATFNSATWTTLLTKVFQQMRDEPFFLTQMLGSSKIFSPTTTIKWRMITTSGKMSSIGLRDDPARNIDYKNTAEDITVTPPQIFERDSIESTEALTSSFNLNELANLNDASDITRSFAYSYGVKLQGLRDRLKRRIEYMFAQLLLTGKISFTTTERTFEKDYSISTTGTLTVSSSTDPLELIGAECETFAQTLGMWPDVILMTPYLARGIMNHSKTEKYISKNNYNFGLLKPRFNSPSVRFIGEFQEFGIPEIYVYSGTYANDSNVATKYIPESSKTSGKMILLNTSQFALGYGAVVDFELKPDGSPIMTDVIVKEKIPEASEGHTKTISLLSYPLPILYNANACKVFTSTISQ